MLLSLQSGCSTPTKGDRHDTHIIIYVYYIRFRQLDIHMSHICALCEGPFTIRGQSIQRKKTHLNDPMIELQTQRRLQHKAPNNTVHLILIHFD